MNPTVTPSLSLAVSLFLLPADLRAAAEAAGEPGASGPWNSTAPTTARPSPSSPSVIYVTDFQLDPSQIQHSERSLGASGGLLGGRRPLSGGPGLQKPKEPADERQQLVSVLAEAIVKQLERDGLRAERLPDLSTEYRPDQAEGKLQIPHGRSALPTSGWMLTGWFERVEEGNAAVEATVGFGKGSGHATADVAISDLAVDATQPFLVMGSGSRAKKSPGGLVTLNPYVMAAKFVISKRQGMEKDVQSLGKQIAKGVVEYISQSRTQAPPGPAKP